MLSRLLLGVDAVLVTVLLGACGSSSSGSVTCSSLTPADCGGNLGGTWALQSTCGNVNASIPGLPTACSASMLTGTPGTPSGTVTFTNGSYNTNLTVNLTLATKLSASCVSSIAPGADVATTCNEIAQASSSEGISFTCTAASGGCDCAANLAHPVVETGSYSTSGNQLSLTPTQSSSGDTSPTTSTYCVRNGHLIMTIPAPFAGGSDLHLIFGKQ